MVTCGNRAGLDAFCRRGVGSGGWEWGRGAREVGGREQRGSLGRAQFMILLTASKKCLIVPDRNFLHAI